MINLMIIPKEQKKNKKIYIKYGFIQRKHTPICSLFFINRSQGVPFIQREERENIEDSMKTIHTPTKK